MTLQDFINKYNGVHIDEDGYYGAQCWDLVARYAREVYGCPSFPTVTGGAAGLFSNTADIIKQYFDRVANNTNNANQIPPDGAIIVWGTTWSPPFGHTAVKTSGGIGQNMTVIEQNGNNPGGAAYIKSRNYTGVTGWLVPKKGTTIAMPSKQDVVSQFRAFQGSDPTAQQIDYYAARAWSVLNEDLLVWNRDRRVELQAAVKDLQTKVAGIPAIQGQLNDLTTKFNELLKVNTLKDSQIADLTAKLATQTDDTKLLNGFGEWLQKLIARLGVKKG